VFPSNPSVSPAKNAIAAQITSARTKAYAALPNLASAHEQGLADFEAPTWFAVFLPRGASETSS
jgi:tripartite-type tricarboxylate transporter receptor subunit TctC